VTAIAGSLTSGSVVSYNDATSLQVGTVLGTAGLNVGAGSVTLAADSLSQSQAITAGTLTTTTATGTDLTGATNAVGTFNATNTSTGDISFKNSGALTISGISHTNAGAASANTTVTNTGTVDVTGDVTTATAANNTQITANGASLTVSALINAAGGTTTLTAGDQIVQNGGSVTSNNLILSAVNGIGAGSPLATAVTNVKATNTTTGSIDIANTSPLTLHDFGGAYAVSNAGGDLNISSTGTLTVLGKVDYLGNATLAASGAAADFVVNNSLTSSTNASNTTLTVQAGNSILVNGASIATIGTGKQDVMLNSDRNGDAAGAIALIGGSAVGSLSSCPV